MKEGWKECVLEDIVEPIKETCIPDPDEQLNYIGLEHIEQESLRLNGVGNSTEVTSNKFKFDVDDILFGKLRVYFRKVVKVKFSGICSTDIWVMRAKEGYNQDFLFYFLANKDFIDLANGGEGGTRMPRADWNFLKITNWNLPPLPEQKVIASVLSSLDDKIDLLHRQNKTLEAMAETLFRQWFVEEAQEDWEEEPLDEAANFLNGLACQKFAPRNNLDKLPVLKIKDLKNGFTNDCDWATSAVSDEYIIENGDIIFAWSASLLVKIWDGTKCILNQHLFKVTSSKYPKWFIYLWTKYHLARFIAIAESKATTMGHIKRNDLSTAIVQIPKKEELNAMDSSMRPIVEKIILNNKQLAILISHRESLLPKLISGEISVSLMGV